MSAFWPFASPEETVASTLNPNARAFTPLNPNAKEFTPQQQSCQRGSPDPESRNSLKESHSSNQESRNSHHESHSSNQEAHSSNQESRIFHQESQKCSTPDIRLDPPSPGDSSARTPDNTLGLKPVAERKVRFRFLSPMNK